MDTSMGTNAIGDFRFAIFCEHPRSSFYTEPFHMCYYHGVETDLVNLTSYLGYELWKVSTTCGIFLESVRAVTGVVLVLGVGSVFCYRLVGYFINKFKKRRSGRSNIEKSVLRRKPITRWVSRELLDSCLNREPDLSDINKEYFGPVDCSDDEQCSSCSDLGGNSVPLNSSNRLITEVKRKEMGPSHSSSAANNTAITYNVHRGVNINAQKSSSNDPQVLSFKFSGHSASSIMSKYPYNKSAPQYLSTHRPNSLPSVHRRRKKPRFCHNQHYDDSNEPEHVFTMSASSRDSRKSIESDRNDTDDDCSSKLDSDEELLNVYGDDEDEDGEFNLRKRSESLVGNYSLQSLWNRQQDMDAVDDEKDFNEDDYCRNISPPPADNERVRESKCKLPVFVMQSSRSVSLSDENQSEAGDLISVNADLSPITPGFVSNSRRSIARDNSFGTASEISEISLDVSGFNNVGKQTDVRIDEIQKEIDDLKRDCLDIECCFSNMNAHGPTPAMYTELVKPCLSDISECSDYSVGDCHGEEKRVESSLRRGIFKQHLTNKSSSGSADSSFDHSSANNSCSSANKSANLSLEWDSMKCSEVSLNGAKPANKLSTVAKVVNSGVDSGSDFGTPLTNCSPEPVPISKAPFDSARSLEWDEEFSEVSNNLSPVAENNHSIRQILDRIDRKSNDKNVPSSVSSSLNSNKNTSLYNINYGVEAPSNKNMWSSMESGYIEEFTESGASCLVTPMTDDRIGMQTICEHEREYHLRTWPVVGERLTKKQLCSLVTLSSDFIKICNHLQLKYFRPIHNDNYSVVRSIILQMLLQGYSPLEQSGGVDIVKKTFSRWIRCNYKWLSFWRYPKSDLCNQDDCLRSMIECLESLDWMTSVVLSSVNSESAVVNMLNSDPDVELQVIEAAKLLMLKSALELFETVSVDKVVPNFVLKLFSRATSSTPEAFMHNHLNHIGCHQELETVDLFLLGYSLGVTICVINPDKNCKVDIMKYYPDCKLGLWPEVYLVKSEETGQLYATVR